MNVHEISDEKLIKGCLKGDQLYQKALFEKHSPRMMGVALRYTRDEDSAHEVLQETFIKVFNNLKSYRKTGSVEGWIRKICVNTALDFIRKNKQLKMQDDIDDMAFKLSSNQANALDDLMAEDLLEVLNLLPDGYRTVFNMFVIDGYSHKEIAEKLDISVNTSKSQFSRARGILKDIIIEKGLL